MKHLTTRADTSLYVLPSKELHGTSVAKVTSLSCNGRLGFIQAFKSGQMHYDEIREAIKLEWTLHPQPLACETAS